MLDLEQVNALVPDDRNRYMDLEKLFQQKGWKVVVALARQNAATALLTAARAQNWDQNRVAIGNHMAWQAIANLEKETKEIYEGKANEMIRLEELASISNENDLE